MLAIKLWNYFKGYVIIKIEGLTLERLLNLALIENIYLWNVKRINHFHVEVCVSKESYPQLTELIRRVGCNEEIIGGVGYPFLFKKIMKRKMFVLGFCLFFSLIIFLSSFIWKIEINGTEQTPNESILKYLEEIEIAPGTFKYKVSTDDVKLKLLERYNYFSFIEVRKKGINLTIDVVEEPIPPEVVDRNYPANVVAAKKGVIEKVIALNGDAVVKEGQIVKENQVLISGSMKSTNTEELYLVHAEGEVLARTFYEKTVEEPILKRIEKETGKIFSQKGLKFGSRGIRYIKDIPFASYKEYIDETSILGWMGIDFPVKIISYEYREIQLQEIKQNLESVKKSNELKAIELINKEFSDGVEIISRNTSHVTENNILKTTVVIETIEDIAKKQIINN